MLLILLVVLLLAAGAAVLAARAEIHGKGRASRTVTVTIEKGSGVAAIADQLKQEGVIRSSLLFRYYVKNTDSASRPAPLRWMPGGRMLNWWMPCPSMQKRSRCG